MKIRIISVGHLAKSEEALLTLQKEYIKRLTPYSSVEIVEVDDLPSKEGASPKEKEAVKTKEGEALLSKIKPSEFVCLLDLAGKELDSESLSKELMSMFVKGGSSITFVIGGSLGLGENIKKRGNASLCLSKLTFTHKMSRIILLEQIYRSFKIANNEPYHK